jgi:hypothetical protein
MFYFASSINHPLNLRSATGGFFWENGASFVILLNLDYLLGATGINGAPSADPRFLRVLPEATFYPTTFGSLSGA